MTTSKPSLPDRLLATYRDPDSFDHAAREFNRLLVAKWKQTHPEPITTAIFRDKLRRLNEPELQHEFRTLEMRMDNDRFRQFRFPSHPLDRCLLTSGVEESPDLQEIVRAVEQFRDFTPDNDPSGLHDFGKVPVNGTEYSFKIDYYDGLLNYGVDPYEDDPVRVLTIRRVDEY